MRYTHIRQSIRAQFAEPNGHTCVPFILGAPGIAKSACALDSIPEHVPEDKRILFHASLRDAVDVMGVPNVAGEYTRWVPPAEFWALRQGEGPCALILDELSDASTPMQNALCGVIYDRRAGNLPLTDELYIVATGNRTEDKSGANRITSKLANRVRRFDMDVNLDDWSAWALKTGVKADVVQFLRFRPGLLSDFDPNRFANPTPRSWARVSQIPDSLPEDIYLGNVMGEVGDGAAAEYVGFKRIYQNLPDLDVVLKSPKTAKVPTDPATLYALAGALARKADTKNFQAVLDYVGRLSPEFGVLTVKDAITVSPKLTSHAAFVTWAQANTSVLL